jgi:hypothetical protein
MHENLQEEFRDKMEKTAPNESKNVKKRYALVMKKAPEVVNAFSKANYDPVAGWDPKYY